MSASITHTPGPWEAAPTVHSHRKALFGRAKNREYFIGTVIGGSQHDLAVFRANIAVIETAPLLLEELEAAEDFMRGFEDDAAQEGIHERLSSMRAAIDKARRRRNSS